MSRSFFRPHFFETFFRHVAFQLCEESWESKYEYVWGLDSDLDLTGGPPSLV